MGLALRALESSLNPAARQIHIRYNCGTCGSGSGIWYAHQRRPSGEGLKLRAGGWEGNDGKESIPVRGNRTKVTQKEDTMWLERRGEEKGVLGSPRSNDPIALGITPRLCL